MWRIYGLEDPRDATIRYVGCTTLKWLSSRLAAHVDQARHPQRQGYPSTRSVWIREVLADGQRPRIVCLQTAFSAEEAAAVESEWIARYGEDLTNLCSGGPGAPDPTPELRARLSEAQRKIWADATPEQRAAVGERGKPHIAKAREARWANATPEDRAKLGHRDPEMLARMLAGSNEYWRGRSHTEESKAKIRAAKLGGKMSDETRAKMAEAQRARRERERNAPE